VERLAAEKVQGRRAGRLSFKLKKPKEMSMEQELSTTIIKKLKRDEEGTAQARGPKTRNEDGAAKEER